MSSVYETPEFASLMEAIRASLADDVPRLMAADWLEEQGEHERAEFIRVQCELKRIEPEVFSKVTGESPSTIPDSLVQKHAALKIRESELLEFNWAPKELSCCKFRRGFIAEVRCTLQDWMGGGECSHPDVDTKLGIVWNHNEERLTLDRKKLQQHCKHCSGNGRSPAHGPAIARAGALERVTLTDRRPLEFTVNDPEIWYWYRSDAAQTDYRLPHDIYKYFGDDSWIAEFDSESAANNALSEACIKWALAQPVKAIA